MRGRGQGMRRVLALITCVPLSAAAHADRRLGPVYDGVFHLLLSPEDLIPLVASALLCGQRGALSPSHPVGRTPRPAFAGGVTGMLAAPRV